MQDTPASEAPRKSSPLRGLVPKIALLAHLSGVGAGLPTQAKGEGHTLDPKAFTRLIDKSDRALFGFV